MQSNDLRGEESPDRPTRTDDERVLIPTADRPVLHYHRERIAGIPECGPIADHYERRPRSDAEAYADPCGSCFDTDLRADGGRE